jgi:NADPH-dependent ferric siderophore reductase
MATERSTERVRHELKFRIAEVARTERITPRVVRVTLKSDDFESFRSDAYDDHVKLFVAAPGTELVLPERGPNGLIFPEGVPRPEARDYTPRSFDREAGELVIDFVLHGGGPATVWAANARPGDRVGIGGPRASFVVRGDFDWYLLVGDETALPAIGRRIEELPDEARIIAFIEVEDPAERQQFSTTANRELHWIFRNAPGTPNLPEMVRTAALPAGTDYAFVAGEAAMAAAVREHLLTARHAGRVHQGGRILAAG